MSKDQAKYDFKAMGQAIKQARLKKGDFNTLPAIHSIIGNSGFCAILNKKADNT